MNHPFEIKCYTKQELALMYYPDSQPRVAVHNLMRWVQSCRPLAMDLAEAGYSKYSKTLTPRHVRIFVKHLGEP